jgi:uncharacterized membrane protein YsdA (DUF1294 family)
VSRRGQWSNRSFDADTRGQRARSVQLTRRRTRSRTSRAEAPAAWTLPRVLVLPGFAAVYWCVASRWPVSRWVAAAYLLASLAAFVAYAIDKAAARSGRWRTREATLHWIGLAGGWPGALIAQQFLRHKTSKPSFVAGFWATVAANVGAFVLLHSPLASRLFA